MGKRKQRLDTLLVQRHLAANRGEAQQLILAGEIRVNGIVRENPASQHQEQAKISRTHTRRFVSRGGDKLAPTLAHLGIDPGGYVCLDIGSSTGGFTDCLLQNDARRVYCVDVGYGILDWKIRQDPRVVVLERTNARFLTSREIPESVDLCVIDASFISLNALLAPILQFFQDSVMILALIKPQFQLAQEKIAPGGVVVDQALHQEAIDMVIDHAAALGLETVNVVPSPVCGTKGNQEFFILLSGKDVMHRTDEQVID